MRNQKGKFWKTKFQLRNQTDKFWKLKNLFKNKESRQMNRTENFLIIKMKKFQSKSVLKGNKNRKNIIKDDKFSKDSPQTSYSKLLLKWLAKV